MSSRIENVPIGAAVKSPAWTAPALLSLAAIVAVVVLERLPTIGFAYLNVDESAYLAIGESLVHGGLPYVDIVDRKPVGLYLIYALAAMLFPDPIIGARVLGLVATTSSAWLIAEIARRFAQASRVAATLAAALFSCYAILYGGDAAQYNVFVMPFVVAAATLVFGAAERLGHGVAPAPQKLGLAGLLLGLAMQIKYTAGFEGMAFGCLLIVVGWRMRAVLTVSDRTRLVAGLGLMIVGGVLPTAIAAGVYWRLGHLDAFVFYNFTVNLVRTATDYPWTLFLGRATEIVGIAVPLTILSLRYAALRREMAGGRTDVVLVIWLLAALFGALIQRQPYLHYFYAVVPPLCIWSALSLQRGVRPWITAFVLLLPVVAYAAGWTYEIADHGSPNLPRVIAKDLRREGVHSLYVFNYFGILYHLSGLPAPTRYTLPTHLLRHLEAASFQFDALAEVGRIVAAQPDVIVVTRPFAANIAPDRIELLTAVVQKDYCVWRAYPAGRDTVYLYRFRGRDASHACE